MRLLNARRAHKRALFLYVPLPVFLAPMMWVGLRKTEQFRKPLKLPEILRWLCWPVGTFWRVLGESLKGPCHGAFNPRRTDKNGRQLECPTRSKPPPQTTAGKTAH